MRVPYAIDVSIHALIAASLRRNPGDSELFAEQGANSRRLTHGERFLWQLEQQ
jgi:hypothetical protein